MRFIMLIAAALLLCSCAQSTKPSLYEQLGGEQGIAAITDGLLQHIAQDKRIVHHFADTDIARFRTLLAEQLCNISGGPCQYTGGSMQESHTGFNITLADYDALVEGLINVMQQQNISIGAQNRLLALLAPMYKDIVYR